MYKLLVPGYEDPYERFFLGRGELMIQNSETGASCCAGFVWNAVQFPDHYFPLEIQGGMYSRRDLIRRADWNMREILSRVPKWHMPGFLQACGISEKAAADYDYESQ